MRVVPRRLALALAALAVAAAPSAAHAATPSAYAMDSGAPGGVSEFDIASDGFLTPKASGPAGAGSSTQDMAIVPSGTSAYAVAGDSSVYQFAIDGAGALSALGSPIAAGTNMSAIAASPDGKSVYAVDRGGDAVYQYSVGGHGLLVPKGSGSVALAGGSDPVSVAVSPDGASVYVVNTSSHDVYRFATGSDGSLQTPPSIVAAGTAPSTIALTPDGHSAYVTDTGGGNVLEYTVAPGGTLGPNPPPSVPDGASPTGIAVSPDGRSVYVANSGNGTVSQYGVAAGGALSPKGGAAGLVGGAAPQRLAVTPSGSRLYVPDSAGGHDVVFELAISGDGSISSSSGRFVGAGPAPTAVTVLPDQGPVASFGATAGAAGSPTAFDGGGSSDSDGSVTHFDWDFGDGTSALNAGPRPIHTYAQAGSYQVTLSVSDDAGCSTGLVFTGRTAYCNGSPAAVTTRTVGVPAPTVATPVFFAGVAAHNQTVKVSKSGLARISVRCPRSTFGSCIGTLSLVTAGKVRVPRRGKARGAARRLLMGQAGFNITSGKAVKIPIQISKAGRKVLARRRVLKTNATINAHDRLMTSRKTAFSVRLKPPKRPKRHR
jgi:DNA-binding beta-propeller fold protein YncE